MMCRKLRLMLGLSLLVLLATCSGQGLDRAACERNSVPTIGRTAEAVATCLDSEVTAEDAVELLRGWGRVADSYWGGALSADLLPGGGDELVLSYHADLVNVIWNPQGKLAILQSIAEGWQVLFESPDPSQERTDGEATLAGNWSFHLSAAGDLTGDGLEDLLVEQRYSNGTHTYLSHTKLFTADAADSELLRVVYLEDGSLTRPSYTVTGQSLQSMIRVNGSPAITHTYQLEGDNFKLAERDINPEAAVKSAQAADGTQWYAFDNPGGSSDQARHGLYRWQDGVLTHFELPFLITCLQVLRDGQLYLGGNGNVWRVEGEELVDLLIQEYAPLDAGFWGLPLEMALSSQGDLWVAAQHRLVHFGRDQSQTYDLLVHRVMLTADDTVWALGWDGVAESDCCFYWVQGDQVESYGFEEPLPVPADLERQIRALQP